MPIFRRLIGRNVRDEMPVENLHKAIIEASHSDTFVYEVKLEKHLKYYSNKYIWNYVLVDIIYNLLSGMEMSVAITGKVFADSYSDDAVGSIKSSYYDSATDRLVLHYEKVTADIIVDTIEGTGIFSFDRVLAFLGFQHYHPVTDIRAIANADDLLIAVYPQGDGESLYIQANNSLIDQALVVEKIRTAFAKFGITPIFMRK